MAELRLSLLAADANIVGYWRYEANSNGTVGPNGTDTSMTYTTGKFGNAATFNGSSSKIVYSFTQPTSAYSIVAWIKPNLTVADTNYRIYDSQDSGSPTTGVVFVLNPSLSGSTVNLRVYHNNGSWSTSSNLSNINDNAYHHVAVTWDGSTHKFYVDGAAQGTPSYTTGVNNSGFLDIGHGRATGTFWNGQIDDVGVFSRVLTLAEIQTLYNDPTAKSAPDTGSGSDTQAITATQTRSETGSGTDTKAISVTVPTRSDTVTGTDTKAITVSQTRSDTGSGTETQSINVTVPTRSDTGSGSDTEATLASIFHSDTGSGADTESIAAFITHSDTGTASEALSLLADIALDETGAGTESAAILATFPLSESVTSSDALQVLALIAQSDSAVSTDALAVMASIAVSESPVASETLSLLAAISLEDAGGDDDTVAILASIALSDTATSLDTLAVAFYIAVQDDTGQGVDSLSIVVSPMIEDSASAEDVIGVIELFRKMIEDAGQGNDEITRAFAQFTLTENGVAADVIDLLKRIYPYTKKTSPYQKLKP